MPASPELLRRLVAETGFGVGALEKVVRLGELAGDVSRHPLLGKVLVLKGGTALNLCWGPPQRLSVDLDYNYVGALERGRMIEERPRVEEAIDELGQRRGYSVQRSSDAFAGRKIFLGYRSTVGSSDRIEVDLNFLFRQHIGDPDPRALWQPGGLDRVPVKVVSLTELCIGKLLALLDRAAPRDAWDVARLPGLAGDLLRSRRFRAGFLAMATVLDHPVHTYTWERFRSRLSDRIIRDQLLPMLARGATPTAEILAEHAWSVVAPLVDLSTDELEFAQAVQHGELRLELLHDPYALLLERHPAIAWKLQNVASHLARKG